MNLLFTMARPTQ